MGNFHFISFPVTIFLLLAFIPLVDWPQIADNARIHFARLLNHAFGASLVLAGNVSMHRTNGKGRSNGDIREPEFAEYFFD